MAEFAACELAAILPRRTRRLYRSNDAMTTTKQSTFGATLRTTILLASLRACWS